MILIRQMYLEVSGRFLRKAFAISFLKEGCLIGGKNVSDGHNVSSLLRQLNNEHHA